MAGWQVSLAHLVLGLTSSCHELAMPIWLDHLHAYPSMSGNTRLRYKEV